MFFVFCLLLTLFFKNVWKLSHHCIDGYVDLHLDRSLSVCVCLCVCEYTYMYTYTYVCIPVDITVCVYIWIYVRLSAFVCLREQEDREKDWEMGVSLVLFVTSTPLLILGFSFPNTLSSWFCPPSELAFGYMSLIFYTSHSLKIIIHYKFFYNLLDSLNFLKVYLFIRGSHVSPNRISLLEFRV